MYCQLCGEEIDFYDISCQQRVGVEVDGADGVPVEAQRFISTGMCSRCGTTSYKEHIDYNETNLTNYDDNTGEKPTETPC